jgi:hypothetical protein
MQVEAEGQELGTTEADGENWLLDNPHNMEKCEQDEAMAICEQSAKFSLTFT